MDRLGLIYSWPYLWINTSEEGNQISFLACLHIGPGVHLMLMQNL